MCSISCTHLLSYIFSLLFFQAGDDGNRVNPSVELYVVDTTQLQLPHRKLHPPEEFKNMSV